MTRPATLFSAAERVAAGTPVEIAVPEFPDTFYTNNIFTEAMPLRRARGPRPAAE
jgi:hypothetical protein